jgi:phage terminase small subunit
LSDREKRFVLEYLIDLNLRAAGVRAGLGKKPSSAGEHASQMRDRPHVAEAIARLMQERYGLQASRIISELGAIA